MAEFKYEVKETLGVLSEGAKDWKREVNMVSWNDREPKFDIRDWSPDHAKMGKGISLTPNEVAILKELLVELDV